MPTALAVFWGEELWRRVRADADSEEMSVYDYMAKRTSPATLLGALAAASDTLTANFGTWKTPWGEINRFQRLTGDIVQPFKVLPKVCIKDKSKCVHRRDCRVDGCIHTRQKNRH